jgi:hypothetical protein
LQRIRWERLGTIPKDAVFAPWEEVMPTIDLSINGGDPIQLNDLKDLGQPTVQEGIDALKMLLDGQLGADLTEPLSSLGKGKSAKLSLSAGNPSWNLPGSVATFTLGASADANFTILQTGDEIFHFDVDFQGGGTRTISVPAAKAYIAIALDFEIDGTLTASSPANSIGISANASAGGTLSYTVENFKCFDATTPILDAVKAAVASFTLPLHSATVENLGDGDCLLYNFDGSLNVGFGVNYGLSGTVSASSITQLSKLFAGNQFYSVTAPSLSYGVNAGASAQFNWSRTYQCFLQRTGGPGNIGKAELHLCVGTDSQRSATFQLNAGISQATPPALTVTTDQILGTLLQKITGSSSADPNDWKLQALNGSAQQAIAAVENEVNKYVTDANNWLSGLFQDLQQKGSITLAAVLSSENKSTSAFTYEFDVSNAGFQAAWDEAMKGDFLDVLKSDAATLDAGSGLEKMHISSTKLTASWFGLNFGSVASQFSQTSIKYLGKGVFALDAQAGADLSTTSKNAATSTRIYFDVSGDGTANDQNAFQVLKPTIAMHGLLSTKGSQSQVSRLGSLLQNLGGGTETDAAGNALNQIAHKPSAGTVIVDITVEQSALARITADQYLNGKQSPPPHTLDQRNFAAMTKAMDSLAQSGEPAEVAGARFTSGYIDSYANWKNFDITINGTTNEDRRGILDIFTLANAISTLPSQPDMSFCTELAMYWCAAQQFMNLCEDLQKSIQLATDASVNWPALAAKIQKAGGDIDPWFGASTILAIGVRALSGGPIAKAPSALGANGSAVVTVTIT